jgi:ribosomal protein L16 Arg81 hydroxylase
VGILAKLSRGTTLVLQGLNRFRLPLTDLCRRLSAEIGHPIFANAYLTPSAARGFAAHCDPYHAWLVQAEGTKKWQLWAPTAEPDVDPPVLEVTLAKEDVLWILRGWWHSGTSEEMPSLHITLTLWATRAKDTPRTMIAGVMSRAEIAQELPPNAFSDNCRTYIKVAAVAAEIVQLMSALGYRRTSRPCQQRSPSAL